MSTLKAPSVSITFAAAATSAVQRSTKGTVALIIRDAALADKTYSLSSSKQIPTALGAANQAAVARAFLGYENPPMKVLLYVMGAADVLAADSAALTWLATQSFDYLAGPAALTEAEAAILEAWIIDQRTNNHAIYKAVLPNTAADSEAIINFAADGIVVGDDTFDAAAYCGRIAGLLAGTPMTISATYAPLTEAEDVTRLTSSARDTAVGAGKLILMWDGEKVKTVRAVNSLQTVASPKTDNWKYIKIVELIDMVTHDKIDELRSDYLSASEEYRTGNEQDRMEAGAKMDSIKSQAEALASSAQDTNTKLDVWDQSAQDTATGVASIVTVLDAWRDTWDLNQTQSKGRSAYTNNSGFNDTGLGDWSVSASSHAYGLSYVPYDNFPVLLHQGEQVKTAVEARSSTNSGRPIVISGNNITVRQGSDISAVAMALADELERRDRIAG